MLQVAWWSSRKPRCGHRTPPVLEQPRAAVGHLLRRLEWTEPCLSGCPLKPRTGASCTDTHRALSGSPTAGQPPWRSDGGDPPTRNCMAASGSTQAAQRHERRRALRGQPDRHGPNFMTFGGVEHAVDRRARRAGGREGWRRAAGRPTMAWSAWCAAAQRAATSVLGAWRLGAGRCCCLSSAPGAAARSAGAHDTRGQAARTAAATLRDLADHNGAIWVIVVSGTRTGRALWPGPVNASMLGA